MHCALREGRVDKALFIGGSGDRGYPAYGRGRRPYCLQQRMGAARQTPQLNRRIFVPCYVSSEEKKPL
jgi:hypothetical protein